MSVACPTVLATTKEEYDIQMKRAASFAPRIQIDLMDGDFAKPRSVDIDKIWWPDNIVADIHLMYKHPMDHIDELVKLKPSLVIIHAEAKVDLKLFAQKLHQAGIAAGICLLADSPVDQIKEVINEFEHLLIFGGTLGSFGGQADLSLATKASEAKELNPRLEIGWDGGVNDKIAKPLSLSGVDVLNAGGFIQKADNPEAAYKLLLQQIS
jgi:ribulose-phosphate 3-epimerase